MNTKLIKDIFRIEKKPQKGLLAVEWVVMGYLFVTLLLLLFTYTKAYNPEEMLVGRLRVVVMTFALWIVYRIVPCRFTHFCRIALQMALLSWWYPDTYEFNRMFPNLDHIFAGWEQSLFGCQPSLLFCKAMDSAVFSELMDLGYASYFPMILVVTLFYFLFRYKDFNRAAFIILGAFFIYYLIYIAVPVAGPQYYYNAVGMDEIARGVFPELHDYFAVNQEALESPGYKDGIFYQMVVDAHNAGERPTAAFPSSHVGISTILMILAFMSKNRKLFLVLVPFYILLCFSTVYIYAHYAIDVIGGWVSAIVFFVVLDIIWRYKLRHKHA
ncbi:phosphatase PAP2 family protein [Xylanibacter muris]